MKEFVLVFLWFISGIAAKHEVHLVPAHVLCPNVSTDHDILLPDPHDCSVYYRCENGSAIPQSCPIGLEWCKILSECTLPILANCTITHKVVTYSPEELATYNSSGIPSPSTPTPPETPSPVDNICLINGARIPNNLDCHSYYECKDHKPVLKHCPHKKSYSCWYGSCVDDKKADCILDGTQDGKKCAKNGAKLGHPDDCTKYYVCENKKVVTKSCANGEEFNPWFLQCYKPILAHCHSSSSTPQTPTTPTIGTTPTPSPTNDICPIPGATLPNPLNCNSYYECQDDEPVLQECPPGLEYSCWDQECLPPVVSECANNIKENDTCTGNGTKIANPDECHTYYECENGVIQKKNCDDTLQYNQWFEMCLHPELAHCKPNNTITTTTEKITNTPAPSETENICPIDGAKLPNPEECNSYYECKDETPHIKYCPDGFEYSCWDQECLPDESANCISQNNQTGQPCSNNGDKMPNPNNCNSYYECVDGTVEIQYCTKELEYNQWYESCMKTSLAHCNSNTTSTSTTESDTSTNNSGETTSPGGSTTNKPITPSPVDNICLINGARIPNNLDCHSYYECKDHKPVLKRCPHKKSYSCWYGSCVDDKKADCILDGTQDGKKCAKNGAKLGHPDDCTKYYICENKKVVTNSCANGEEFNPWFLQCYKPILAHCHSSSSTPQTPTTPTIGTTPTPSPTNDICPIPGATLPNPLNCNSYYECQDDEPVLQECPPGLEYSCWDQECLPPVVSECANDIKENDTCTGNGTKIANPDECHTYYECENGVIQKKNCDDTLQYNQWFEMCLHPELAHCEPNNTITTTTEKITNTPAPSENANICPIDGAKLPNPEKCNSYYECKDETPHIKYCPDGFEYSCWDQECLPDESANCISQNNQTGQPCSNNGDKMPNPNNCNSYYECVDGTVEIQYCTKELEYNQWYESCMKTSLAHCNSNNASNNTTKPETTTTPGGNNSSDSGETTSPGDSGITTAPGDTNTNNSGETTSPGDSGITTAPGDTNTNNSGETTLPGDSGITTAPGGNNSSDSGETPSTGGSTTNKPITPSPVDNICVINGATIPNNLDCHSYYECKEQKPILKHCPHNKSYSCWYGSCVDDKIADCILDGTQDGKKCAKNGAKLGHPDDCTKYYVCENKKVVTKSCENGEEFNPWFLQCYKPILAHCHSSSSTPQTPTTPTIGTTPTPSSTNDICPIPGATLPNPLNCNSYYECQDDEPVLQECPPGLEYSCWDQECLPPVISECANNIKENDTCTGNGTKIANPDECHTYYECENGEIQKKNCDDTLQYNQWFEMCLHPELAHCKPNNTITTTTEKITNTPAPSETENICPIDGAKLPNAEECNSYYECKDETPHIKYCPDGFEYSCWDQECLPDESANCISQNNQTGQPCSNNGDKIPNPNNCNSYYECVDGTVEIQYCTKELEYNQWYESCMKTSLAHCNSNTTSTSTTESDTNTNNSGETTSPGDSGITTAPGDTNTNNSGETTSPGDSGITTAPGGNNSSDSGETPSTGGSTTNKPITPSPVDNICVINGARIPNNLDCHSYYECKKQKPILKHCPHNKSYSCWYGSCVDDKIADCILDGTQDGKKCAKNGAKLGHPDDCTKYYVCENKKVVTKSCENGEEFNPWFLQCYKPILAHCHSSSSTPQTPTTPTIGTTPTPSPTNDICPIPGATLPNPLNCNSYYECQDDEPVLEECPPGLEYSCWDQECLPPVVSECANNIKENDTCTGNGTKIANPDECHTYYECENGVIQKKNCDDTLQYNQWFEMCLHPELAHCKPNNTITTTTEKITNTPAPSETENICPIDGAKLPNPEECNSYYECKDETPHIKYCPDGFEYSCWDQECLPDESANCISQNNQTGQPCSNNGDKMPNPNNCNSYYECVDGTVEIQYCTKELEYNQWYESCMKTSLAHCNSNTTSTSTTESDTSTNNSGETTSPGGSTTNKPITPSPVDNICLINGARIPNNLDCHSYYECKDHKPVLKRCPHKKSYSCWYGSCVDDKKADCILDGTQDGKKCAKNGAKLGHPDDCTKYYICENKKVVTNSCANGEEFNPWFLQCYKPILAHCHSSSSTPQTPTTPTIGTTPTPSPTNDICPIPGATLPNPLNCNSYYECQDDEPVLQECPPGLEYSCWDQECLPPVVSECANDIKENDTCTGNGTKIANPDECHTYYECENGVIQKKNCDDTLQYNQWFEMCLHPELAHCEPNNTITTTTEKITNTPAPSENANICPIDGAKLPNPEKCNSYYECKDETPHIKYCPDGFEYSCWDQECLPDESANCISQNNQTGQPCSNNGDKMPNPNNCNSYYECVDGTVEIQYCTKELEYNQWYESCMKTSLAHCNSNNASNNTTKPETTTTPGGNNSSDSGETTSPGDSGITTAPGDTNTNNSGETTSPGDSGITTAPGDTNTNNSGETTSPGDSGITTAPGGNNSSDSGETPSTGGSTTNKPITPSPVDNICVINGARIPNNLDCHSYYECKKQKPILKHCPHNKSYSCWYGSCVDDKIADCILDGTQDGKKCAKNGAKLGHPDDCTKYYVCENKKVVTKSCENGEEFNPWFLQCYKPILAHCHSSSSTPQTPTTPTIGTTPTPSPTNDICPIPGATLPNPLNCNSYYECQDDEPVLQECPPGLEYSCWDQECLPPVISECANNIKENDTCTGNGTKIANPDECHTYYECENGEIQKKNCDDTLQYNQWFEMCLHPELAHCKPNNTITTTTEKITNTPAPSETENICPIDGAKLPNAEECNSYYECKDETPHIKYCPDGFEYSCWDQECLPDESANCISQNNQTGQPCSNNGDKMPNPNNCNSYYECVDGTVEIQYCTKELEYNQWYESCMKTSLAHCNSNNASNNTTEPETTTTPGGTNSSDSAETTSSDGSEKTTASGGTNTNEPGITSSPGGPEPTTAPGGTNTNEPGITPSPGGPEPTTVPGGTNTNEPGITPSPGGPEPTTAPGGTNTNEPGNTPSPGGPEPTTAPGGNNSSDSGETPSTGGSTTNKPITPSPVDNICLINGARIPNNLDCHSYYECKDQMPILKHCPPEKSYSCWYGSCVDDKIADCILDGTQDGKKCAKNGAKLGHPDDCTKYYVCENKKVVTKSCENGEEFNPWFLQCYKPILAHCHSSSSTPQTPTTPTIGTTPTPSPTNDICPIPGATLPNPLNCNSYYECQDDEPVLQECPPGLEYSCWDQECLPPVVSECANNIKENDTCTGNGTKIANPDECHTYYECENGVIQKKNCDDTLQYNQWFEMCLHPELAHCKPNNTLTTTTEKITNTPAPSEIANICPIDGAKLPNPEECNSYYECKDETPHIKYCPDGFEYSCWDQECLPDESANCISQNNQTGQPCSNNGDKMPNPNNCNSYYECVDGTVEIQYCTKELEYNQWYESCMKTSLAHCNSNTTSTSTTESETTTTPSGQNPCKPGSTTPPCGPSATGIICPHNDVALPNPTNCSLFYKCVNGTQQVKQCNTSEKFSSWLGQCVDANTAICIGEGSIEGELCAVNGEKLGYPQDCGKYYECVNNSAVLKSCPIGEEFNVWFGACYEPKLAHCHKYTEISTTVSTEGTTVTLSPIINICRENGDLLPNLLDCRSYYECQNNTPVKMMCPENLYYSCWDLQCLPKSLAHCVIIDANNTDSCVDKDRMPNPENCHTYYECINGTAELQHCNDSLEYNAWNKICVHPSLSHCASNINITTTTEQSSSTQPPSESKDICPIEGSTLPNLLDCGSYYQCHNNQAVLKNCTAGYIYSCWDQVCLPALTANCLNKDKQEGQACSTEGEKLPNAQNCSTFYQCVHRKVQLMSCESGLEFNSWFQKCTNTSLAWCHTYPALESGSNGTTSSDTTESTSSTLPTNVTPSPSLNICPINGAKLPNELNCKSYYECEDQWPVPKQCPPNLAYDCWEQKCTAEEAATCINQGNQEGHSCSNNGEKLPNINNCSSYYQCVNSIVHIQICADGLFYNQWFGICVEITLAHCQTNSSDTSTTEGTTITPATEYDICPIEHALLPNPTDCSTYYRCENKIPVLKMCQQGYAYSCWDQQCLPASEADCIAEGSQQDKNCSKEGQQLPNIEDCSGYYECKHGKVISKQCRPGTQYNKWFGICLPESLSHCVPLSTLPTPTTTSHPTTTLTPSPDHDICPINGALLPNPSNCSSYYICENGNPTIHYCAIGLEYSCWEQACLPPADANCIAVGSQTGKNCSIEGQKTQNPDNCHTYYQCVNGKVETKFCQTNWYYNKWFGICLPSLLLSHCKIVPTQTTPTTTMTTTTSAPSENVDICPIEGALLPDPMDCNAYYKCENESAVLQHCPTGEEYSCWDQMCKPATEAECINSGEQVGKNCSKEGERLQDPASCSSYYECIKGVVERQYCFLGFKYNKWYGHCVLFFLSHCETYSTTSSPSNKSTTESTVTTSVPQSTQSPSPNADICPEENALLPNPANCSTYYRCQNGTPILQLCPQGLEYSCWDEACLPPKKAKCIAAGSQTGNDCSKNGQRMQNPENCHSYYQCVNGKVETKVCPLNGYYNKWFKICVPTLLLSHCNTNKTEPTSTTTYKPSTTTGCGTNGAKFPSPKHCRQYYVCENGSPVLYSCQPGYSYDCWDQTCTRTSDTRCIATGKSFVGDKCTRNGQTVAKVSDCNEYYECVNGKIVEKKCEFLQQYSFWQSKCVLEGLATCANDKFLGII